MAKHQFVIFVCVLSALNVCYSLQDIPPFLHICKRSNPDIKECMKQSIEALRPHLQNGNPEYNIPSVEPIVINDLIKEESGSLKIQTTDVVAHGGSNYRVDDIVVNFETYTFDVDVLVPTLTIDAKYRLDGKVVMIPIRGEGSFEGNLTECRGKCTLIGHVVEKDGNKYLEFTENIMKITVGSGKVHLGNLFNGDKTMTKMINDAVNDNLQAFLKELMPYIEKGLAKNFMNTANQIISPYTLDQLFPM